MNIDTTHPTLNSFRPWRASTMPVNFIARLIDWLITWRWVLLVIALIAGGWGMYAGQDLGMDRSLEKMFAPNDPLLGPYEQLQRAFGKHQLVLAIYKDPRLTTPEGLARASKLAVEAENLPGIVDVVTLHDVPGLVNSEGTAINTTRRAEKLKEVFSAYTHSDTLDAVGIVCLLENDSNATVTTSETLTTLRALIERYPGGVLVGEPILIDEAFDLLEKDGRRLNTWCMALLLLTIFICFRQLRWLVLPLVLVQITLAMTRGTLVMLGLELSMVSSMLAAIVTVVGVAAIMHVIVHYRDLRLAGRPPREALSETGQDVAVPLFFACLTDSLGFASLMVSSVKPVSDFGLMMAIGSLMVLLVIALVSPAIILFAADRDRMKPEPEATRLQKNLHSLYEWSCRHARALGVVSAAITIVSLVGNTMLLQETDFTKNFREDSDIVRGFRYVDEQFGGAGVWDILIPAPVTLSREFVLQVLEFETTLRDKAPGLTKVTSIADMLDAGSGGLKRISFGGDMAVRASLGLVRGRLPEFIATIYNPTSKDQRYLRVMLRAPERLDASEKSELIDQVQTTAREFHPQAEVTGYFVLFTHLIESLLRDQWTTFAVSTVSILLVMVWAFRSFPLALVTMIPSTIPIFWLFGAMGWMGIKINMGAAMIAAVSVGLSVDGSIHYVMSYQNLRRNGMGRDAALASVQSTVGRAAVLATLALMVGFTTLCVSEFIPTVYFGSLVSLTMVGGLVGNLMALPLLIRMVEE